MAARLALEARPAETVRLADWVAAVTATHGLSGDVAFRLDVCLAEAVSNVIAYAFDNPTGHTVAVLAERQGDALAVAVEDDGRPFDPLQVSPPEPPTSLEAAPIGGYGIHLIRSMADEVRYERRNDRNRLLMAFRESGGAAQ
jgi:serine/threonine-protein kinase RsbW